MVLLLIRLDANAVAPQLPWKAHLAPLRTTVEAPISVQHVYDYHVCPVRGQDSLVSFMQISEHSTWEIGITQKQNMVDRESFSRLDLHCHCQHCLPNHGAKNIAGTCDQADRETQDTSAIYGLEPFPELDLACRCDQCLSAGMVNGDRRTPEDAGESTGKSWA